MYRNFISVFFLLLIVKIVTIVQEHVALESKIADEDINRILQPAYHNRTIGSVYNLYSMKVLRYELIRYLARKNKMENLEENIDEIDVEYPGIPKILKKNRD